MSNSNDSNDQHRSFEHRISPIPFLMDTSPLESGPPSPGGEESSSFDNRPPLRAEWEVDHDVMGSFDRLSPSDVRYMRVTSSYGSAEQSIFTPWNGSMDSDDWDSRRTARLLHTSATEHSSGNRSGNEAGGSSTVSDTGATGGSPSSEAPPGNAEERVVAPMASVNDENGDRTPEADHSQHDVINDSENTSVSSLQTSDLDLEQESVVVEGMMETPPALNDVDAFDENGRPLGRRARNLQEVSPIRFLADEMAHLAPQRLARINLNLGDERENATARGACETARTRGGRTRRARGSSEAKQPAPFKLPTSTRLGITINKWNVAATWKWNAGDETCGICRMPFEACCIECKTPGDECPLAIGACKHAFHMHCIVKWTETQNTPRPQCPLCRQEWKFAAG